VIDLHTHVLPGWDDGASDQAEAERMLAVAREDGISKIVLTPHVHRMTKNGAGLESLKGRIEAFREQAGELGVGLFAGAEVYFHIDMIRHIKDFGLTVNGSNYVFIEFPADYLPGGVQKLVSQMMFEGLIPIISHPERNVALAQAPEALHKLVSQGAVSQVTSQSITGGFGRRTQKAAVNFLKHGLVQVIASDAHNATSRPPRLAQAVEMAAKTVGRAAAEAMVTTVPAAILENEQIPDFGEPSFPD
jgi:protein-tyrosine phosphatase